MVTRTERFEITDETVNLIKNFEQAGWRVRQVVYVNMRSFLIVVFEAGV